MWVFGYGSLMWGEWERKYQATQRVIGELQGYRRIFNKKSVKNWGTPQYPAPTVNLEAAAGTSCTGVVFEFPDVQRSAVTKYLHRREGEGFIPHELLVHVAAAEILATVFLYEGPDTLPMHNLGEIADSAKLAHGTKGSGADYVTSVKKDFDKLGINDPAVTALHDALMVVR